MLYDVFISSTSTDVRIAERLSDYLDYYNITSFVANRDIPADVPWAQGIAEAIKNSKMMIVLFSEDYNSGTWMDGELQTAANADVPILTFRLSDVPFAETKISFLKNTAHVDGLDDIEGKFPTLYEEVCNLFGMPIDLPLPVNEVLVEQQPLTVATSTQKVEKPVVEKQTETAKKEVVKEEEIPATKVSHNLLPAVVIGLLLTFAVIMFLEWVLK